MKKLYLLFAFTILSVIRLSAQTDHDFDYYIDFNQSNEKIYFQYVDGQYIAQVDKIGSDFKIYSSQYKPGTSDQDRYIFGAADGNGGITPDSEKDLSHPGSNLSIEGGGILYDVTFIFDPVNMKLTIKGGSPTPTKPSLGIIIVSTTGTSPESGELTFKLQYTRPEGASTPTQYSVTALYTNNSGVEMTQDILLPADNLSGTFTFTDLKPGQLNHIALEATTTVDGTKLTAQAIAPITTPELPILIGQISGHEWQPNYGIHGVQFTEIPDGKTYYYTVNLTGNGEFSFVTKLGNSSSDWTTVNNNIRYAPATNRVAAPNKTWMPYTVFKGSTENAWYPENFEPGTYVVEFDYTSKSIAVIKGDIPTGVDDVATDTAPEKVDVYSIAGIPVRENVDYDNATAGLPHGLYIVNGKKIAVR